MTEQPPAPNPPTTPPLPSPPTTAWAIAALIFGIIGAWFVGIICGVIALTKTKTGQFGGRTMAIAGLILSGLWIIIGIIAIAAILLLDSDSSASRTYVPAAGTCFAAEPDANFAENAAISCDQAHQVEVFAIYTIPGDAFPGHTVTGKYIDRCESEFAQYAAEDAGNVQIEDFIPTESSWAQGDRTVICFAVSAESVTGSRKG